MFILFSHLRHIHEQHYEHLFKANSPPVPPTEAETKAAAAAPAGRGGGRRVLPAHSHYLQSKVVRAIERIKAEQAGEPPAAEGAGVDAAAAGTKAEDPGTSPPPQA